MNPSAFEEFATLPVVREPAFLLLQVTVVATLGLLGARPFRRDPATRHAILFVALLALLAAPCLAIALHIADFSPWKVPLRSLASRLDQDLNLTPAVETRQAVPVAAPTGVTATSNSSSMTAAAEASDRDAAMGERSATMKVILHTALNVCLAVWGSGIVILIARLLKGFGLVRHLREESIQLDQASIQALYELLPPHLKEPRPPQIVVHDTIPTAFAAGILHPVVMLPRGYVETLSSEELAAVLAHEIAHIIRRDPLAGLLQRVVAMLYWVHPLVHLVNRQLNRAREEVCDNVVLRQQPPAKYADLLLRLVQSLPTDPNRADALPSWTISFLDPRWKLEQRIAGILDAQRKQTIHCWRPLFAVAALLFLAVIIPLAGIRASTAPPKSTAAVAPPSEYEAMLELQTLKVSSFGDLSNRWHHWNFLQLIKRNNQPAQNTDFFENLAREPVRREELYEVPEAAWPVIAKLKSIESLWLGPLHMTDAAWENISKLPRLRNLSAGHMRSTSGGITQLKQAKQLESLAFNFYGLFPNAARRKQLLGEFTPAEAEFRNRYLQKHGKRWENMPDDAIFTDRLLEQLAPLENLRRLTLTNTYLSSRGIRALAPFHELEEFDGLPLEFTVADARLLGSLIHLKKIGQLSLDDARLAELRPLKHLMSLNAWCEGLTDQSVELLLGMPGLQQLSINGNHLTDKGLLRLAELKHLQRLDTAWAQQITPAAIHEFHRLRPECQIRFVNKTTKIEYPPPSPEGQGIRGR